MPDTYTYPWGCKHLLTNTPPTPAGVGVLVLTVADAAQVYRIKDLDTGKEFIVDAEAQEDRREPSLVQLETGEQISMGQFESQLGLDGGGGSPKTPGSPLGEEIGRREALEAGARGREGGGRGEGDEPAGLGGGHSGIAGHDDSTFGGGGVDGSAGGSARNGGADGL